jgi:hypothetical protein
MEALIPLFGILVPFATAFGIIFIIFSTRHRERMNMIEKGMDPDAAKPAPDPNKAMKNGLLLIGIGIGLLVGWVIQHFVLGADSDSVLPYFIGVAVFGGLSLVVYYIRFGRRQEV